MRSARLFIAILGASCAAWTTHAGDLTPPAGPVQATDRIVLNAQTITLPHTITQPGSYVLTSDFNGSLSDGFIISANDVTLDLGGFTLNGAGATGLGIHVIPGVINIRVVNGTIRGWGTHGVLSEGDGCRFERLHLAKNMSFGFWSTRAAQIYDCVARENLNEGIRAGNNSIVERCIASENGSNGINAGNWVVVRDCVANDNLNGTGISTIRSATIENCVSAGNLAGFAMNTESVASGCTASMNAVMGFNVVGASQLVNCTASENIDNGFNLISAGGDVIDCTSRRNGGHGISTGDNGLYRGNVCEENTAAGIYILGVGNRVESNNLTTNDVGIDLDNPNAPGNIIIKNSAHGNITGNYNLGASSHGPIIDVSLGGDFIFYAGAEHPWANFEY